MTMRLEIRSLQGVDIDDLRTWHPASPADVYEMLELEIGEAGVPGAHIFQLLLATPEGLGAHHKGEMLKFFSAMQERAKTFVTDALVVVDHYDWNEVRETLVRRVASCERSTWNESLECLRRKFFWEYEDIKYR
ncbi:Imm8 family immunity protein [Variovorax paradoxus]|uniref:Uncharacterized protein n=1 Tax=Variovorax paradoxus TaxID=34073 RepID=A0A0H2M3H5_VARPD|nr:Imm8 family immunity protein [Variovorax paradoxus]KLN56938.1 hypothetical protein VPARA_16450 [Variovorax paradoxus]